MPRPRAHRKDTREPGLTKTERLAMERIRGPLWELDAEGIDPYLHLAARVPDAWDTLDADVDVDEPREKVTLYLDRSVSKFWRAQGRGYHERINRVLAVYAQMQIARVNRHNRWWMEYRKLVRTGMDRDEAAVLATERWG